MLVSSLTSSMERLSLDPMLESVDLIGEILDKELSNLTTRKQALAGAGLCLKAAYRTVQCILSRENLPDPLVSDTQCQNRAVFVAHFANTLAKEALQKLLAEIAAQQKILHVLLSKKDDERLESPNTYLRAQKIGIMVPRVVAALISCTILNETKIEKRVNVICHDCGQEAIYQKEETAYGRVCSIQKGLESDHKLLVRLVERLKRVLAETSISFLQQEVVKADPQLASAISERSVKIINGIPRLPCVYSLQAVCTVAAARKLPIVLEVRRAKHTVDSIKDPCDVLLLYRPKLERDGIKLELVPDPDSDLMNTPAIVIGAQRCSKECASEERDEYVRRLHREDLMELILMNAIHHYQYERGDKLEDIPQIRLALEKNESDRTADDLSALRRLEHLKHLYLKAEKMGCTDENQALLTIKHIFASTLAHRQKTLKRQGTLACAEKGPQERKGEAA